MQCTIDCIWNVTQCVYAMCDGDLGQQYGTALESYLGVSTTDWVIYIIQVLIVIVETFFELSYTEND